MARSDEAAAAKFVDTLEKFFGPGDEISFKVAKEEDGTELFFANAGLDKKSGLLFRTVTAEARVSLMKILQQKGLKIEQVNSDILTAYASATMGTYVGVEAGASLVELEASIFNANLGFGVGTGMGIKDGSVVVKILGTGVKLGQKIGVSVLGSGFEVDFGKLPWNEVVDALNKGGDEIDRWRIQAQKDSAAWLAQAGDDTVKWVEQAADDTYKWVEEAAKKTWSSVSFWKWM